MNFLIETPRLKVREFCEADWEAVHEYAADVEVVRFMNWGPNTEADTKAFIAKAIDLGKRRPRRGYHLAVVSQATGKVIGGAALKVQEADPGSGEVGYTLHRMAWGQGLGTELAQALIKFGFETLKLQRIWATCRPDNLGSYRILRKAGLRFEDYLQNERMVRGHLVDSFLCGLSRDSWLKAQELNGVTVEMPKEH